MRWAFAAVALSSLALVGAPGAAERADQIVGTWSYGAGAVTIVELPPSTQREVVVSFAGTPVRGAGSLGSEYMRSPGGGRIVATSSGGKTSVSGSLLLIHTIGNEGHLSVLIARSVRFPAAGRAVVTVTVGRSTSPQCEAGSAGTLIFRDGKPDLVGVAACGWSLEYRDGAPEGSAVLVRFPS